MSHHQSDSIERLIEQGYSRVQAIKMVYEKGNGNNNPMDKIPTTVTQDIPIRQVSPPESQVIMIC